MIVRFRRTMAREELLRELTEEHGSIQAFRKRARRHVEKRAILEEWEHHLRQKDRHERITIEHDVVFHDPQEFLRAWTPQRLALYEYLKAHRGIASLHQLAKRLGRNYRNVYEDAHRLADARILYLERRHRSLVPRVLVDEVTVTA